jgi:hypothetical protein
MTGGWFAAEATPSSIDLSDGSLPISPASKGHPWAIEAGRTKKMPATIRTARIKNRLICFFLIAQMNLSLCLALNFPISSLTIYLISSPLIFLLAH